MPLKKIVPLLAEFIFIYCDIFNQNTLHMSEKKICNIKIKCRNWNCNYGYHIKELKTLLASFSLWYIFKGLSHLAFLPKLGLNKRSANITITGVKQVITMVSLWRHSWGNPKLASKWSIKWTNGITIESHIAL